MDVVVDVVLSLSLFLPLGGSIAALYVKKVSLQPRLGMFLRTK